MLIYNITFLVSDKVHGTWLKWVRDEHIPFMLESTYFSHPQIARVVTGEKEDGTSFSVQYHVNDIRTLKQWNQKYSATFQQDCSEKFGQEVLFFTTVLELIQ